MATIEVEPKRPPGPVVRANLRALPAVAVVAAVIGSAGLGWAVGGASGAGDWLRRAFESYVDAQLAMVRASSNVNDDGEAEYALIASGTLDAAALADLAADHAGVRFLRLSVLPGSAVVGLVPGDREALGGLRSDPRVSMVLPNRGLWICH